MLVNSTKNVLRGNNRADHNVQQQNISQSIIRRAAHGGGPGAENVHSSGGIPGENLPFKLGGNPYVMALKFTIFYGIGWWIPAMELVYMMNKQG